MLLRTQKLSTTPKSTLLYRSVPTFERYLPHRIGPGWCARPRPCWSWSSTSARSTRSPRRRHRPLQTRVQAEPEILAAGRPVPCQPRRQQSLRYY